MMKQENNFVKYITLDENLIESLPEKHNVNCKICEENHLDHKSQIFKSILIFLVAIVALAIIILLEQGILFKYQSDKTHRNTSNTYWNDSTLFSTNDN
jgi:hypothetical protein